VVVYIPFLFVALVFVRLIFAVGRIYRASFSLVVFVGFARVAQHSGIRRVYTKAADILLANIAADCWAILFPILGFVPANRRNGICGVSATDTACVLIHGQVIVHCHVYVTPFSFLGSRCCCGDSCFGTSNRYK